VQAQALPQGQPGGGGDGAVDGSSAEEQQLRGWGLSWHLPLAAPAQLARTVVVWLVFLAALGVVGLWCLWLAVGGLECRVGSSTLLALHAGVWGRLGFVLVGGVLAGLGQPAAKACWLHSGCGQQGAASSSSS
jgi:hypothetical protein